VAARCQSKKRCKLCSNSPIVQQKVKTVEKVNKTLGLSNHRYTKITQSVHRDPFDSPINSSSDLKSERASGGIAAPGEESRSRKTKDDVNEEPRLGI
jgi:hypothetical protein